MEWYDGGEFAVFKPGESGVAADREGEAEGWSGGGFPEGCHIDGILSKGGGDGIGCTKAGKGVKIMIMVDANLSRKESR